MRILFISPRVEKRGFQWAMYPPLGLMTLSAVLKKEGHEVVFLDGAIEDLNAETLADIVKDYQPGLTGLPVNVMQLNQARLYAECLKKTCPDIPLVAGGPLISAVSRDVFEFLPGIDYAVFSEGEYALPALVRHLQGQENLESVPNLIYQEDSQTRLNQVVRVDPLDELPLPDYSLVERYLPAYPGVFPCLHKPSFSILCSRGCPFDCQFCSSPVTWERRVTTRGLDSIIREIRMLADRYGAREVFIQDDTLNLNRQWFLSLCDALIESGLNKRLAFKAPFRANRNLVDEDLLNTARRAGFWMLFYGVESGSPRMLEQMKKRIGIEEIIRAFELTHRAGIQTFASFILGFPGETSDTIEASFDLTRRIQPHYGGFGVAMPFPGTGLYEDVRRLGLADHMEPEDYDLAKAGLRTESLSHEQLCRFASRGDTLIHEVSLTGREASATWNTRPLDEAAFRSQIHPVYIPSPLPPDFMGEFRVKIENLSRFNWPGAESPDGTFNLYLSYHWLDEHGQPVCWDGVRTKLGRDIPPGGTITADARVLTPARAGSYTLQFDLVQENAGWFSDRGCEALAVGVRVEELAGHVWHNLLEE